MKITFGRFAGFPEFLVLDSTDPAQVRAIEKQIDIRKTLFIVSSKSGTTLEPNIFLQYFYDRLKQAIGGENAEQETAKHFIAITDPGSQLEKVADREEIPRRLRLEFPASADDILRFQISESCPPRCKV